MEPADIATNEIWLGIGSQACSMRQTLDLAKILCSDPGSLGVDRRQREMLSKGASKISGAFIEAAFSNNENDRQLTIAIPAEALLASAGKGGAKKMLLELAARENPESKWIGIAFRRIAKRNWGEAFSPCFGEGPHGDESDSRIAAEALRDVAMGLHARASEGGSWEFESHAFFQSQNKMEAAMRCLERAFEGLAIPMEPGASARQAAASAASRAAMGSTALPTQAAGAPLRRKSI